MFKQFQGLTVQDVKNYMVNGLYMDEIDVCEALSYGLSEILRNWMQSEIKECIDFNGYDSSSVDL